MENIFIAIVTDDKEYGRSLSLGILSICRGFIIRIFNAEEFLSEDREYDLILWDGDEVSQVYGGRIIYLAEKPSDIAKNIAEKRFSIYKYSTAASIVASVFEIYEVLTGRRAVNLRKQDVRIFAFASCAGGTGCTTVTMAVSQELCRFQGKRVLYLSFEELDSAGCYMINDTGIKGAAVYLYELFNKMYSEVKGRETNVECVPFLEKHMIKDDFGVEAFASGCGRNPLRELNPGELHKFMASLIDSGRFDVILMDMGHWLSKTALKCLELAEKVFIVTDSVQNSIKYDQYICHVVNNCGETALDKIVTVHNNKFDEKRAGEVAGNKSDDMKEYFTVCKCESFIIDGRRKGFVLEGGFGRDINILTENMMEA